MTTKEMLKQIIKVFNVSSYWLEKFLGVEHAKFNRYVRGITEARFNDVNQWLTLLGLCVCQDELFCIEHMNNQNKIPFNKEPKLFINGKLDAIQDNLLWIHSGKSIEEKEGHKIFRGSILELSKK